MHGGGAPTISRRIEARPLLSMHDPPEGGPYDPKDRGRTATGLPCYYPAPLHAETATPPSSGGTVKAIRLLLAVVFVYSIASLSGSSLRAAQTTYSNLFTMTGTVIAKGTNTNPVGPNGVKTYRIEELTLPAGTQIMVEDTTVQAKTAWRVTILGTAFSPRDLPPVVSIDSTDLRPAQESTDLTQVSAITFDRSLIHDGAIISLSYGTERTQLPERVKLGTR